MSQILVRFALMTIFWRRLLNCEAAYVRRPIIRPCYSMTRRTTLRQQSFSSLDDIMQAVLHLSSSDNTATASSSSSPLTNNSPIVDQQSTLNSSLQISKNGWKILDWSCTGDNQEFHLPDPSPVQSIVIRDRLIHLKRDDLWKLDSQISGNKARKLLGLEARSMNHLESASPMLPASCIVSYGGSQSNAMLALAALVHFSNQKSSHQNSTRFVYYTKKLSKFLRTSPSGNLFRALALGMELRELSPSDYDKLFGGEWGGSPYPPVGLLPPVPGDSLYIPQGGACGVALSGTRVLAREIYDYWKSAYGSGGDPLSVVIPGGTCTTAVLTHVALRELQAIDSNPLDIQVVVIPCVGDEAYARRQMQNIISHIKTIQVPDLPAILSPSPDDDSSTYFSFAEPHAEILQTYREMEAEHEVRLDLLYGAPAWTILLRHLSASSNKKRTAIGASSSFDPKAPLDGRRIMYIHSGGLEGINSQLLRYKYKNLLSIDDVQLPGRNDKLNTKQ
jgi:1-aminocyclopropane-1-carboxylate deaminase/D-cysteine desulfhydrase-like pyridoxal-dependent ACC family enzyme